MAQFPYIQLGGFEQGALNVGMALTDTETKAAYLHYTDTAAKYGFVPWRGAYCWVIDQSGASTTAAMQTVAAFNVADTNYYSVGWAFYADRTVMADGERTTIMEIDSGTTTNEVTLALYYTTASGLQLLLSETAATAVSASTPTTPISERQWHWIEIHGINASAAGTAYLELDGYPIGSITGLSVAAFTDLYFGLPVIAAGHNAGVYAFDDFTISGVDTSAVRIGYRSRFSMNVHVGARSNASDTSALGYGEHIFIGPGTVDEVSLLTATAGDMIRLFDTDRGYTTGDYGMVAEANFSSGYPVISGPLEFNRGCYCVVYPGGTTGARGIVRISTAPDEGYSKALYYGSPANLKNYATKGRTELPGYM